MLELTGHEGAVNSLHQVNEKELISGSWDGTCRVWDLETGKVKETFEGHTHATTVLGFQDGLIVTGSQDGIIHQWRNGKEVHKFKGHNDIVRGFTSVPAMQGFASCSNDEMVKLWCLDGTHLIDFKGHQGFVFAVDSLDSGEIISGGDDCVVKVWDGGECKQTIQMPRTIWSVTHNKLGDLIVGCEDKSFKTFTRDAARAEKGKDLEEYQNDCKAGA
jgi:phospholipase A-2-activating protein